MGGWIRSAKRFGLAPLLLVAFSALAPEAALGQPQSPLMEKKKTAIIRELMDDPKRLDLQALRQDFPAVFAAMEAELGANIERQLASGEMLPSDVAYQRGFDQGLETYRRFLAEHIHYLGKTTEEAALRVLLDRGDISIHVAQTDVQQCAIFAMTNNMRGFRRDDRELLRLLMLWSADVIKAIKLGMTMPNQDNVPNEKDAEALMEGAIALGLNESEIERFLNASEETASPQDQCFGGTIIGAVVANMKRPSRGRMARYILAQ